MGRLTWSLTTSNFLCVCFLFFFFFKQVFALIDFFFFIWEAQLVKEKNIPKLTLDSRGGYLDTSSWIVLTPNRKMEFVRSRRLKLEWLCAPVEYFLNFDHFPISKNFFNTVSLPYYRHTGWESRDTTCMLVLLTSTLNGSVVVLLFLTSVRTVTDP